MEEEDKQVIINVPKTQEIHEAKWSGAFAVFSYQLFQFLALISMMLFVGHCNGCVDVVKVIHG